MEGGETAMNFALVWASGSRITTVVPEPSLGWIERVPSHFSIHVLAARMPFPVRLPKVISSEPRRAGAVVAHFNQYCRVSLAAAGDRHCAQNRCANL
jgi:hypothetical protein